MSSQPSSSAALRVLVAELRDGILHSSQYQLAQIADALCRGATQGLLRELHAVAERSGCIPRRLGRSVFLSPPPCIFKHISAFLEIGDHMSADQVGEGGAFFASSACETGYCH